MARAAAARAARKRLIIENSSPTRSDSVNGIVRQRISNSNVNSLYHMPYQPKLLPLPKLVMPPFSSKGITAEEVRTLAPARKTLSPFKDPNCSYCKQLPYQEISNQDGRKN